jgi:hypothetical protein
MAALERRDTDRVLKWSAVVFAIGFGIHGLDHLRRGMSASPMAVIIGGNLQAVLVIIAVAMVLTSRYRAPEAAIGIGFGSAVLFTYAHLLPTFWSDLQDSYISLPHTNVTWFSWLSAVAEIGTGILFGLAGIRAAREPAAQCRNIVEV